jgi:hypothetical protein
VGNGFGLAGESSMGICGMGGGRKRKQGKEGITSFFVLGGISEFVLRARVQESIKLSLSLSIFISSYIGAFFQIPLPICLFKSIP